MGTIRKEIVIPAPAEEVWKALRDVGRAHERLTPGVLVDCRMEGDARLVTFANGLVVKERIVTIDDAAMRVAYAVVGGPPAHHNASMQVVAEGPRTSRLVWISDFLPDEFARVAAPLIEVGAEAMKKALGQQPDPSSQDCPG
ncbi:SRPBCC family protein [Archangium violaceum]|uniref:SRPBCC family protein n=1 Tax=Archangium violaceum TaxID=83451 RepID=UPI00193C2D52|nr:SRPBCC family protein [Archangium violaceum]QRK11743.1 SRPBCC family protein [Archangium violaceum]